MKIFKRLVFILIMLLIVLAITWGVINKDVVKEKYNAITTKLAKKYPAIGKFMGLGTEGEEDKEKEEEEKKQEIVEVKGFKIAQIHFTDILPAVGTLKSIREIKLRFEINGRLDSFNFRPGDIVEEGDIISEINHSDAQLKVKFREAKLAAAKTRMQAGQKKLEQYKKLFEIGAIIKPKLEEIELEYQNAVEELKAAQVELESAKYELEKTYLQSPIDGVLIDKQVEAGEYVSSNTQVASLGEIGELYLEIGIIEKDFERIRLGQKVTLSVDTYPDDEFEGEIDNIFPSIEGKSRTITIRVKVDNPENRLLPGMFASAQITVYEKENAIIVPPLAVDKTDEGYQVFIVDKDNKIHKSIIDIEYTGNPEYWVVAEGLNAGDIVVNEVVSAQRSQLKDDMEVELIETEEYTF